jgi:GlpG protein
MRQAGTIPNQTEANRFADYLFAQGIVTKVDRDGESWAIWVREEEQVRRAVEELAQFLANPADEKYADASGEAKARREQLSKKQEQARRNFVDMRRRRDGGPAGPIPLTMGLIVLCIVVAILTNLGGQFSARDDGPARGLMDKLLLVPTWSMQDVIENNRLSSYEDLLDPPSRETIEGRLRWGALEAVRGGEVWRLVTPILLHFGPWHLLMNMVLFYRLGGMIEGKRGALRFGFLVLLSAVLSNFSQFFVPSLMNPFRAYFPFGGMSGVVYALFGYIWMKSRYEPAAELYINPNTVVFLLIWLAACSLGFIDGIANWAHGTGLAIGLAIGIAPYAWRQTLNRLGWTKL